MSAEVSLPGVPLRAEAVTAGYGGDPVIRDISVGVDPGEVISLVGPNGSGKSTLLKSLVGVIRISADRVDRLVLAAFTYTGQGSPTLADRAKQLRQWSQTARVSLLRSF